MQTLLIVLFASVVLAMNTMTIKGMFFFPPFFFPSECKCVFCACQCVFCACVCISCQIVSKKKTHTDSNTKTKKKEWMEGTSRVISPQLQGSRESGRCWGSKPTARLEPSWSLYLWGHLFLNWFRIRSVLFAHPFKVSIPSPLGGPQYNNRQLQEVNLKLWRPIATRPGVEQNFLVFENWNCKVTDVKTQQTDNVPARGAMTTLLIQNAKSATAHVTLKCGRSYWTDVTRGASSDVWQMPV